MWIDSLAEYLCLVVVRDSQTLFRVQAPADAVPIDLKLIAASTAKRPKSQRN
jgi:hypothetical protein